MCPKGSAGGCYFLPLSLPPEARRSRSSVRLISLTPPGVSTNQVLKYIVKDIVYASVYGVRGYTPAGHAGKIFIDVIGFVGDYPASASVVDVVGHVGNNPCTVCSFRRLPVSGTEGSRFGYTGNVHASNSAFMRHGERHYSLRKSGISDEDAIILGMVGEHRYSDDTCPLLHLQRIMQSQKSRSALTSGGVPVVSNSFDAFRCNVIAPDHLLTGLSKDVLNAMFRSLPTKELRMKSDAYICSALRNNCLLHQKQVFNSWKNTLHSMTLSELFCVLVVSVPTFKQIVKECPLEHISRGCYRLLTRLQRLIALTYWWPIRELDGGKAVTLVHKDKEAYFSDLKTMSTRYVEDVDGMCKKSEIAKQVMDKPNLHRVIELYEHTVPAFGHVRGVMELVFESAHQPLKRCISRSNNRDAHVFAVEHCVGNDWQSRIAALIRRTSHPHNEIRTATKRGLRRLLLGEQADLLDEERHIEFITKVDSVIHNLFTPALTKKFEKDNMISNVSVPKVSVWKARVSKSITYLCGPMNARESDAREIANVSKRWIEAVYPIVPDLEGNNVEADDIIRLFARARRVKLSESGRQVNKPSGHDTIAANSSVQVYLDPSMASHKLLVSNPGATEARPFFFAILAVLQKKEEIPFALCFKCRKRGEYLQKEGSLDMETFQILRLTQDVRRVAIYHVCAGKAENGSACKWEVRTGMVSQTKSLLLGGRFYFQARVHGYPPRIA